MSRDQEIQQVFEIADDSLQGMIGYHMYVDALQKAVKEKELLHWLPDQRFQMTFSWDRFYQKQDLVKAFEVEISELYQCKLLLVEVTNVFEASLKDFIDLLKQKGFPQLHGGKKIARNYKSYITWAFNQARKCDVGDKKAIERLSGTFGTIDNTRRLRNLIVHNHWVLMHLKV